MLLRMLARLGVWMAGAVLAAAAFAQEAGGGTGTGAPVIDLHPDQPVVNLASHGRAWVDPQGTATIDAVAAGVPPVAWEPRQDDRQDRIDGGALWIAFSVRIQGEEAWYLEVGTSSVDEATLYHRGPDGQWQVQRAGERVAVATWPLPGRVPTFALAAPPGEVAHYWLRIEQARIDFAAPLLLVREDALVTGREREQFLLGAYFGLAAVVALASLASGIAFRDRAFLAYAAYVILLATGQLSRLGIVAQHLWPHSPAWIEASAELFSGLSGIAALWFVMVVTEPRRTSRALDTAAWAAIAIGVVAVLVDAVVGTRATLAAMLACTALAMAMLMVLIAWAWRDGRDPDIRLIALGFLPVVVFALFPLARGLNLIPHGTLTRYGLFIGAVLEMPILFHALSVRSRRRRESELREAALPHSDALTGLANRRALVERLEAALARAHAGQPCALLAVRIANLEALAGEFGRDTVDKALVVAASHLRRVVTERDCAARVGPNEFALLLESPMTGSEAMSRAQQVVASGLRPSEVLPAPATLKFHVAVALLPQNQLGAAGSLEWALEALAGMPPETRKMIRGLNF